MSNSVIQSVIFDKRYNNLDDCLKWLDDYKFKHSKAFDTERNYRFRQVSTSILRSDGYTHYRWFQVDKKRKIYFVIAFKPVERMSEYLYLNS